MASLILDRSMRCSVPQLMVYLASIHWLDHQLSSFHRHDLDANSLASFGIDSIAFMLFHGLSFSSFICRYACLSVTDLLASASLRLARSECVNVGLQINSTFYLNLVSASCIVFCISLGAALVCAASGM